MPDEYPILELFIFKDKYHTQTLKAVIRRMGKYKSRQGGDIDFNFELSCPLFKSVWDVWDNFFRYVL